MQIDQSRVVEVDDNGSITVQRFLQAVVPSSGTHHVPVEGRVIDRDGVVVDILLHVHGGMFESLQILREDCGALLDEIRAEDIETVVYESEAR